MNKAESFSYSLNTEEWIMATSRNMSPFLDYLSGNGIFEYSKDFGIDATVERIAVGRAMHQDMFFNKESMEICGQRIVRAALTDKNFLKNLKTITLDKIKKLTDVSERISKSKVNSKIFNEYCKEWKRLAPSLWITMVLGRAFNDMLTRELSERLSEPKEKIEEIISILTYPDESTPLKEEELEILELCSDIQNKKIDNKDVKESIRKIYEKYKFLPVNYVGESWDIKFFEKEVKTYIKNFDCKQRIQELRKSHEDMIHKRNILERGLALTGKERLEVYTLRTATFLNEIRKLAFCKANYLIRPFLDSIAKDIGLRDWKDASYLSNKEILEVIENKNIEKHKNNIKERQKLYVFTRTKENEFIIFSGKDANIISEKLQKKHAKKSKRSDSVNGVIASKGKAVGRVKILLTAEDNHKVRRGDVIIAKMTSVDFLPAMRLASSFVTNEGGISCHAAIVAREMNKPCLIATGFATDAFSDNDIVEVDAITGIVKKVSQEQLDKYKELKTEKKTIHRIIKQTKARSDMICWFDSVNKNDVNLVGGKGANLGELSSKFNVPNGFCITVNVYEEFLEKNKINPVNLLKGIDLEDAKSVDKISNKIKNVMMKSGFPKEIENDILKHYNSLKNKNVSVRSSATLEDMPFASFAGQHDTYLNVKGEENVICSVKKCFASLFTTRAIYYRKGNKLNHNLAKMSVVVQEMVDADYAGVMFTIDPVNKKHLIIEIVKGLGEEIVSGKVTPNRYILDKNEMEMIEKNERFKFDSKIVNGVARIGIGIEKHFKSPQDIEFAIRDKRIFILQSRNITTL